MISAEHTDAYLNRLGFDGPVAITSAGLAELHEAHLQAIPFENLSVRLAERVSLESAALVSKILSGRGGFCYELNGAFAALLVALGFPTSLLEARVYDGTELGIRFDHLALQVDLDGSYLVDVGFGDSFLRPVPLDRTGSHVDASGSYEVTPGLEGWFDLVANGEAQYSFSREPRELTDFVDGAQFHSTSAASPFTSSTICSIATRRGRITINDHTLITTSDGNRTKRTLDDAELLDAFRTHFGIVLDRIPGVPAAV